MSGEEWWSLVCLLLLKLFLRNNWLSVALSPRLFWIHRIMAFWQSARLSWQQWAGKWCQLLHGAGNGPGPSSEPWTLGIVLLQVIVEALKWILPLTQPFELKENFNLLKFLFVLADWPNNLIQLSSVNAEERYESCCSTWLLCLHSEGLKFPYKQIILRTAVLYLKNNQGKLRI